MSQDSIQVVVQHLADTSSGDAQRRKASESALNELSKQPGVPVLLLQLQQMPQVHENVRLSAAIFFKNFVKAYWAEKSNTLPSLDPNAREQIKANLVTLMLSVPPKIQRIISEALSIISASDFPNDWQSLLPELVSKCNTPDLKVVNGILKTIHSIFKGYRHKFRSDEVLKELKYILTHFQAPFLQLFVMTTSAINANANNTAALQECFTTALLLSKIFYSLNAIDIPEYFEDNMSAFMAHFSKYLNYQTTAAALLEADDEAKPGVLLKVQAQVCANINQYTEKYEEEFQPLLGGFVQEVWNLLAKTTLDLKYDKLVHSAIRFLTSVATSVHHSMFGNEGALQSLCANIVIPNMRLREADEELFEDNPVDYIRGDIEGGDTDTRRRSALELVKGLRKHYEAQVTQIFSADITKMLASYAQNPGKNWKDKDTAVYLVTALAVRSQTAQAGTTAVNQLVPIVDFFNSQILAELQNPTNASPILKADALKFTSTFRRQLPKEMSVGIFGLLVNSLADPNYVIHTYAASCIERMLIEKDKSRFEAAVYAKTLGSLVQSLKLPQSKENEYLMKAVMRVCVVGGADIAAYAGPTLTALVEILARVSANPTNPSFNHFLFETIASLVRTACTAQPQMITACEGLLFPIFQQILQADVIEFMPYVFQLISMMIDVSPTPISQVYGGLFHPFLNPALWQRPGNIPALVPLMQAYIRKAPEVAVPHIEGVLGIFQKLNASSLHDHEAFYILEAVVQYIKWEVFKPYLDQIFKLIFGRLGSHKTTKYIKSFLVFLSLLFCKHDPTAVIATIDAIQPKIFSMVLESIWIPNVAKVDGLFERKMASIAMTKMLIECPVVLRDYTPSWPKLLNCQLTLLELPHDESSVEGDVEGGGGDYGGDEGAQGFSGAYSLLIYAATPEVDSFASVDPKLYFAKSLAAFLPAQPQANQLVQGLVPQAQEVLKKYIAAANA